MMNLLQSKFVFYKNIIACMLLSFVFSLLFFNVFSNDIGHITLLEYFASFVCSLGIDIIFITIYYNFFKKDFVKIEDGMITFQKKTFLFEDIADIIVDSTFHKKTSNIILITGKEKMSFLIDKQEVEALLQLLPKIEIVKNNVKNLKMDSKQASDTFLMILLNTIFYMVTLLGILVVVIVSFKLSNRENFVETIYRGYVYISTAIIWVVATVIVCLIHAYKTKKYHDYKIDFCDDCVIFSYGKKNVNSRKVFKENITAVTVKQSLIEKLAGKFKVRIVNKCNGGDFNDFDYFPFLLTEEQKDMVIEDLLSTDIIGEKTKKQKLRCSIETCVILVAYSIIVLVLSFFFTLSLVLAILPMLYVYIMISINKFSCVKGNIFLIGYGVNSRVLYVKLDKIERFILEKNFIENWVDASFVTIKLEGGREEMLLGVYEEALFEEIVKKLKND